MGQIGGLFSGKSSNPGTDVADPNNPGIISGVDTSQYPDNPVFDAARRALMQDEIAHRTGANKIIQPFTAEDVTRGQQQGQLGMESARNAMDVSRGGLTMAERGVTTQQQLVNALQRQGGLANQADVFNQLQGVAAGQGPNPAQAMLQQATGQNVANQAALMAGQRGASANPALIARQIGNAGVNAQQQAAAQAANLQAQQSLGALGQLGGLANQQVANQIGATQNFGQQAQGYGQLAQGYGQLGQGMGKLGLEQQQQATNALMNQNLQNIEIERIRNAKEAGEAEREQKLIGGIASGVGTAASLMLAKGGEITENPKLEKVAKENRFPAFTHMPPHLEQLAAIYHPHHGFGHTHENRSFGGGHFAEGGHVPPNVHKEGGKIKGEAKYPGNDSRNDVVPAKLSKGEIVLPNSVTQSRDPVGAAAKFVAALEAKKHGSSHHKEFKEALGRAIKTRKKK